MWQSRHAWWHARPWNLSQLNHRFNRGYGALVSFNLVNWMWQDFPIYLIWRCCWYLLRKQRDSDNILGMTDIFSRTFNAQMHGVTIPKAASWKPWHVLTSLPMCWLTEICLQGKRIDGLSTCQGHWSPLAYITHREWPTRVVQLPYCLSLCGQN